MTEEKEAKREADWQRRLEVLIHGGHGMDSIDEIEYVKEQYVEGVYNEEELEKRLEQLLGTEL